MRKITNPCKPDEKKYIFTEGINYLKTGKASIWGSDDDIVLDFLTKAKVGGKWLHLAAGDGRSNTRLLKKADFVVASDIDKSALSKLWYNTPKKYRPKLKIRAFNATKRFPFKSASFDGVFCIGTLHCFPRKVFIKVSHEIDRVLKPRGRAVIDFSTDIKRIRLDGKPYNLNREPGYTLREAKAFLRDVFKNYRIKMHVSRVPEEIYKQANPPYKFSSNLILLVADKKSYN